MITRRRPPVKRFGTKTYHASQIDKINRKTPEICNQLAVSFCGKGVIWKEKATLFELLFLYIFFSIFMQPYLLYRSPLGTSIFCFIEF